MGNSFKCEPETLNRIYEEFKVDTKKVEMLKKYYEKMVESIPYQYLAHIIRTIEVYVRDNIEGSEDFRITCKPISTKMLKDLAYGELSHDSYKEFYSYDILYYRNEKENTELDEIQQRVCIAHELGHLLLIIMTKTDFTISNHEPLSTVYGILITLHKLSCKDTKRTGFSQKEVMDGFVLMANRLKEKYNMS